ncbi:MAG: hypothetical protein IPM34_09675 [Saprospiraceae bacterium]|nr:hypothetical protein [Saprospiraceae bacterium]
MIRFYIFFLLLILAWNEFYAQSYVNMYAEDSDYKITKAVSMYSVGNLSATPANKYLGMNAVDEKNGKAGILVSQFLNPLEIKSSIFFTIPEGKLELVKLFGDGDYEMYLFGMFENASGETYPFVAKYNYRLQQLSSFKVIDLPNDPDLRLNLKDVISEADQFYLLASTEIDYLSARHQKVVLFNYNGNGIPWAKTYNVVAPIHSEAPTHLTFDPNGNIAIAGTIKSSGDNFDRMMLMQVNTNGDPGLLKKVELLAPNLTFSNRYGWTYVKTRGTNVHLFSQAVIGGSEPGQLLVTMFDVNYALRTWRNYTVPIKAEFSMIDGNFFYFGGQSPLGSVYNGYTMVRVNSSNAIVEAVKYFEKGIHNENTETSSTACYDRANDKIWSAVKSNNKSDHGVLVIENPSSLTHLCGSNLTSTVAKDTMRITDLTLSAKNLELRLSDFSALAQDIKMLSKEICETTNQDDYAVNRIETFYRPDVQTLTIHKDQPLKDLQLIDYSGKSIFNMTDHSDGPVEVKVPLPAGIYFLRAHTENGLRHISKFAVSY